jgi:hypothetical protein
MDAKLTAGNCAEVPSPDHDPACPIPVLAMGDDTGRVDNLADLLRLTDSADLKELSDRVDEAVESLGWVESILEGGSAG